MEPFFKAYLASWSLACLLALVVLWRQRHAVALCQRAYWHFLAEPWKLATFAAGGGLITLIGPYTGDPTWDVVDGFFMSVLCFTTAPWVVATLYLNARARCRLSETYLALCVWLFSASWSYDLYLVLRDGFYPDTWFPNLFASSLIYLCAGLFWNLEWHTERGVIFSFMRPSWPSRPEHSAFFKLLIYALIFALPAIWAVLIFMLDL